MNIDFENGLQALFAGDLSKAESFLTKAIEIDPNHADAHFHRGKVHWQNGKLTAAINDFQKALDINPTHNQALVSLDMVKQIIGFRNPDLYNP